MDWNESGTIRALANWSAYQMSVWFTRHPLVIPTPRARFCFDRDVREAAAKLVHLVISGQAPPAWHKSDDGLTYSDQIRTLVPEPMSWELMASTGQPMVCREVEVQYTVDRRRFCVRLSLQVPVNRTRRSASTPWFEVALGVASNDPKEIALQAACIADLMLDHLERAIDADQRGAA